jgi:hypothetical protein
VVRGSSPTIKEGFVTKRSIIELDDGALPNGLLPWRALSGDGALPNGRATAPARDEW